MTPKLLAAALSVALGPASSAAPQGNPPPPSPLFPGVAYVEIFGVPSNEFVQVLFGSKTIDIGPVKQYFYSGGFAGGDFSVEYAIDYVAGDLYSIDTSNGLATRIGAPITGDFLPYGPKWNPLTGTSYVIVRGGSCDSTALYTIDLTTAATKLVGNSAGCITAMAIDPVTGTMYGFDALTDNFVVVDQSSGAIQYFASGFPLNNASAMDFDPANGLLYVIGEDADPPNPVLYAYVPGSGLEAVGYLGKGGFGAFAFARRDGFFNGFETLGFILKPGDR